LNAGNVTKDGFSFSDKSFITQEKDDELRKGRLEKYDVVITTRGTVGNVALYDNKVPFEHIRINSGMLILKSGKDILSEYLYYYLKGKKFQSQISLFVSGSAQPQLPKSTLGKMSISYPNNKDTQNKIVSILKSLDDKIEVNRKINENLEQQAQALFKSWFVDFEPFKNGEFVESELGMIPKGWRVEELENICTIKYGKGLGKNDLTQKGFPVFGGNGIIGFYTQYLYELPQILVSCRGAASGKIIESLPQSYVTSNSLVLELKDRFYYNYLKFLLLSSPLYDYATGSAQPQITIDNIKGVKILLPLQEAIQKMNPTLENIGNIQRTNEQESRCLAELRDTLLPKLMSGELKVGDVTL
jgi:type I restriction enzyme S subunit